MHVMNLSTSLQVYLRYSYLGHLHIFNFSVPVILLLLHNSKGFIAIALTI